MKFLFYQNDLSIKNNIVREKADKPDPLPFSQQQKDHKPFQQVLFK